MAENTSFVILCPYAPYHKNLSMLSNAIRNSRTLGDTSMVSILSSKMELDTNFGLRALSMFNIEFVYLYLMYFVVISAIIVVGKWYDRVGALHQMSCALLHQSVSSKRCTFKNGCALLVGNFVLLSLLVHIFIANIFLDMVTFTPISYITTMEDLIKYPHLKVAIYRGDPSEDLFCDPIKQKQLYDVFHNRIELLSKL